MVVFGFNKFRKTFVGEIAAKQAIADGVVFFGPALVNEKFEYFDELYGTRLGMRAIRCNRRL